MKRTCSTQSYHIDCRLRHFSAKTRRSPMHYCRNSRAFSRARKRLAQGMNPTHFLPLFAQCRRRLFTLDEGLWKVRHHWRIIRSSAGRSPRARMDLRYVLAFYVLLLAFLVWVCVLADPESESLGGKLNFYLTEKIPDYFDSLLQKVLPARVYGALYNVYDYVANQRNPVLQGLYLFLYLGSLAVYITQGWRRMSEADILITCGLSVVCLLSFSLASTVPPGFVTTETIGRHRQYECDDVLYTQGRMCSTCNTEKVARSKHCRLCGGCIARFDHHCGWLNQCVGEENYRHFLAFLAIHVVTFAYGCTRIVKVFLDEVARKRLLTATFYNAQTGKPVKSTPLVVVQYFIAHEGALVGVLALAGVMAVVIAGFLGYHLLLVARNVTTNETFKWQEVKRKVKSEREALQRAKEISGGLFEEEGPPNPKNLYDRGLLGNVWEVLHPRSRRQVLHSKGSKLQRRKAD